jgi:spore germination protein
LFVHVVKPGESLISIAKDYGGTPEKIRELNELPSDRIVPGLHLLIPAGPAATLVPYIIQEGDTIDTLAREFRVPPRIIVGSNESIQRTGFKQGQTVWLPVPIREKREIEVNAYIIPTGTQADAEVIRDVAPHITYLSTYSYRVTQDGRLVDVSDTHLLSEVKRQAVMPHMTVSNFDGNRFNPELARAIMNREGIKQTLYENIFHVIRRKGYQGVHVDFEHMYPEDRELYNDFIRGLAAFMKPKGISVSLTLGPKMNDDFQNRWMGAFDYDTLGTLADSVMITTYDWGSVGGPPLPIAPLHLVKKVLQYAISLIPANKIFMGMALYGYDWSTPFVPGIRARGIAPKAAVNMAIHQGAVIQWHHASASPTYTYRGERGEFRQVWFEDARSVMAKFHLVQEMGVRGISYWVLGCPFPQNWALLEKTFTVRQKVGQFS